MHEHESSKMGLSVEFWKTNFRGRDGANAWEAEPSAGQRAMGSTRRSSELVGANGGGLGDFWRRSLVSGSRTVWAPSSLWQLKLNWWKTRPFDCSLASLSNILDHLRYEGPWMVAIPMHGYSPHSLFFACSPLSPFFSLVFLPVFSKQSQEAEMHKTWISSTSMGGWI